MTEAVGQQPHLWSIVLAGGDGERIRPLTERWLGRHTPKQYCAFVGTRSMLQHTLDRAARLSAPERTVTVIARGHLPLVRQQLSTRQSTIIPQPLNRDTAVGMFLALTYVRAADPEATVVILPADHFVHPEARFLEAVRCGVWAAETVGPCCLAGRRPRSSGARIWLDSTRPEPCLDRRPSGAGGASVLGKAGPGESPSGHGARGALEHVRAGGQARNSLDLGMVLPA